MIFLRPFFLLFLAMPFLLKKFQITGGKNFKKLCDKEFLPFLTIRKDKRPLYKRGKVLFLLFWILGCLALAGPAFEKKKVPAFKEEERIVLVLDLSPTMQDEEKLRLKLYDIVEALKGKTVGVVLYDSKAYPVVPLTEDLNIIKKMIPLLSPKIMPDGFSSHPEKALEKAEELLKAGVISKGQILLLTGGILEESAFSKAVSKLDYPLGILGVGSEVPKPMLLPDGAFYKDENNRPLMNKINPSFLKKQGRYAPLSFDGKDIQRLLYSGQKTSSKKEGKLLVDWKDAGIYLVYIMTPFVLFLFRKGMFVFGLFFFLSFGSNANPFLRADQEDYLLRKEAVEAYQKKDFKKALDLFTSTKTQTAEDLYNQGNALAHLGKIEEAIEKYKKALVLNQEHKDALFNKEYLEKQLPKKNKENRTDKNKEQNQQKKAGQSQNQNEDKDQNKKDEQKKSSQPLAKKEQDKGQKGMTPSAKDKEKNKEQKAENKKQTASPSSVQNQKDKPVPQKPLIVNVAAKGRGSEKQEWLLEVPNDPTLLLKARLKKQYEEE
ncbi:MAG: VWA domain-containing protein [Alphaproteobacteria bacterium]|nr:VWA domain-containing protein [Alphaproteobacteria bacterium]